MKNTKQVKNKLHQIVLGTKLGNIKNLRCMVQCENFISDSEKFSMISLFFYMAFLFVFNFETFFLALSWYITALFTISICDEKKKEHTNKHVIAVLY
jgi:hypothetical protein